jgi:oligoribonuclease NrnB/cAMP/cGMP phosphodiesterase (DHH superfamily)
MEKVEKYISAYRLKKYCLDGLKDFKKARIFKNPDWADQITKAFIEDIDEQPSIEAASEEWYASPLASPEEARDEKKLFVRNLGLFFRQTSEGVDRMYLDDNEVVHIVYTGGGEHTVSVEMDNFTAIVRDVAGAVQ